MDVKIPLFEDITEHTLDYIYDWVRNIDDGSDVTLQICSAGGFVFYAYGIIDLFKARKFNVTAEIFGMAASAAAIIALACERVKMAPFGSIMLHGAYATDQEGNVVEPDDGVRRANDLQIEIIKRRCPSFDVESLKEDRWYSANQALGLGFADEIIQDVQNISAFGKKYCAYLSKNGEKNMENDEKKPCEAAVKAEDAGMDAPSTDDVLEKTVEKVSEHDSKLMDHDRILEEILHRLGVLEGEGKKEDDIAEQEGENAVLARRKSLYAKISKIASPKCAAAGKAEKKIERRSKIDLNKFLD